MKIFTFLFKKKTSRDFFNVVTDASSKEKKKIVREAVRAANRDQKKLVEEYDRLFRNGGKRPLLRGLRG